MSASLCFKKYHSTTENIAYLLGMLHQVRGRKKKPLLVLIDLKKVFDSIDRGTLLTLLSILLNRTRDEADHHIINLIQ